MSKPVELTCSQWNKLYLKLREDYPQGVMLIRSRMKDKLGFVNRDYTVYDPMMGYKRSVMLDFYSEKKRTFFLMKYSEILNDKEKTV